MKEKLGPGVMVVAIAIVLLIVGIAGWRMFGPSGGAGSDNDKESAYIKAHPGSVPK